MGKRSKSFLTECRRPSDYHLEYFQKLTQTKMTSFVVVSRRLREVTGGTRKETLTAKHTLVKPNIVKQRQISFDRKKLGKFVSHKQA